MSLKEKLKHFVETDYHAIATDVEAEAAIEFLTDLHREVGEAIEDAIAPLAVKFQINAYLGEYDAGGRSVVLTKEAGEYAGREVGEWMYSSETC